MTRYRRIVCVLIMLASFSLAAEAALAQIGPFSFSFATSFLNSVFLLPFRLAGCG